MYWFFYGYQDTCLPGTGSHDADWERVAVKLKRGRLERVMFFQHAGHYTRQGQDLSYFEGTHPVAFVGKNSHGSYHDDGGTGSCLYFEDHRNPGERNFSMRTWQNLVELSDGFGAPEWMRTRSSQYFDGITPPLARDIDICALAGCRGKDFQLGSTLCFGQCGCSKSSIGDAPF
jgi:Vacuolar protein sorting-associated protein 62